MLNLVALLSGRPARVAVSASAIALAIACGPSPSTPTPQTPAKPKGPVVATVAGVDVTVSDLEKKLEEQSPFVRARYSDPEKKKELLAAEVRFRALAAEARARGFDKDPEVEEAINKIIVQRLTREEFDGRVNLKDVTDAEMLAYFDAHKADYQKPEMVRASFIALTQQNRDEAKKLATEAQKAAADPKAKDDRAAWKGLVEKYSTDAESKPAAGDLRYLSREDAVARFGEEAAKWLFGSDEQNEVSPVIATSTGFAVFKRTGKRKAIERTFEQVKNQIKNVVYREKRTAAFNTFVESLEKKHGAKSFPDALSSLKIDVTPAMLNGGDDGHGHGAHGGMMGGEGGGMMGGEGGAAGAGGAGGDGDDGAAGAPSGAGGAGGAGGAPPKPLAPG
jgi:peptidyl-prolyl cis-trans isomerase C